jgi:hypothetical protein
MSTKVMNEVWGVTGEVEPLAFVPEVVGPESLFVFFANGEYYWYSYAELQRFEGPFADHDDFFAASRRQGALGRMCGSQTPAWVLLK